MAANLIDILANRSNPTQLSNLVLDATMGVDYKYVNKKTSYQVEDGAEITDHVRQMPDIVVIKGHFASHPLRILEGQIPAEGDRVDLAHTELLRLAGRVAPKQPGEPEGTTTPEIIDIILGLRIFTKMMITQLDIPITPNDRYSLPFTLTAEKFETAQTQLSVVNNADSLDNKAENIEDQAQKKVNAGVNKTTPVPESSTLNDIINTIFGKTKESQDSARPSGATQ